MKIVIVPQINVFNELVNVTNQLSLNIYDIVTVIIDYCRLSYLRNGYIAPTQPNTHESSILNELINDITPTYVNIPESRKDLLMMTINYAIFHFSSQLEMFLPTLSRKQLIHSTTRVISIHPHRVEFTLINYVN